MQNAVRSAALPSTARLRRWVHAALARDAAITLRVVGRAEGRALNRRYRRRDTATNVLSFPYTQRPRVTGDLVLCAPVIAAEARAQGKTFEAHVAHLVVHGTLHLQGYDHVRTAAAERMETRERKILARLGFADPYQSGE
ncbi:MAG: rRNA maturation RNase YbeY [Burkholderiales bacterium]